MTAEGALTTDAVLARLQKMEQLSRRRGYVGSAALVVAAAAVLLARTALFPRWHARDREPRQVERVVEEVAGLSTDAGRWPRLFLSGDGVIIGTLLTVSPGGAPGLALYDPRGEPRAVLGQVLLGRAAGTPPVHDRVPFSLTFVDQQGNVVRRLPR